MGWEAASHRAARLALLNRLPAGLSVAIGKSGTQQERAKGSRPLEGGVSEHLALRSQRPRLSMRLGTVAIARRVPSATTVSRRLTSVYTCRERASHMLI